MPAAASDRVDVRAPASASRHTEEILTSEAAAFVAALHRDFDPRRRELLAARVERQRAFDAGVLPDFLAETRGIRESDWRVARAPADWNDRRVEITGPPSPKMAINALNSGANVWMADFEDATSPTWANLMEGQVVVRDAVRRTLRFEQPGGKRYTLADRVATLCVRPRGWHLPERHFLVDGAPVSASLFDFGLAFFHNARAQLDRGSGPYFYLPKLESHLEARLWNDVFNAAQDRLDLPRGSVRATVLIETIPAAFEMDEILYELRDHAAGLNAGRWDYIFSIIKKFRNRSDFVLPDRARVTMNVPFMRTYAQRLVRTCHRRGAHAIGGMAAFIPSRTDQAVNEAATAKVREDKLRESGDGFDGTWVAHPDLVPLAREVFDAVLGTAPNQKDTMRDDLQVGARELVDVRIPDATITAAGVRTNVDVGLRYLDAWLGGTGAAAIYNLMEDAATAEISRAQLWQWIRHGARTDDGAVVTRELYASVRDDVVRTLEQERLVQGSDAAGRSRLRDAVQLLDALVLSDQFEEFLTLQGYPRLLES
jgi:malate synthase